MSKPVVVTLVFDKMRANGSLVEDPVRGLLTRRTLAKLHEEKYDTVAVYSPETTDETKDIVRKTTHALEQDGGGIGPSFRQGIRYARDELGADAVLWTEPEKLPFVEFIPEVVKPVYEGRASHVVPMRREILGHPPLQSYPVFQRYSETAINVILSSLLAGRTTEPGDPEFLDLAFGPQVWSREAARSCLDYEQLRFPGKQDGWDARYVQFLIKAKGGPIVSVPTDFTYPAEQRAWEEETQAVWIKKRMDQANCLVNAAQGLLDTYPEYRPKPVA